MTSVEEYLAYDRESWCRHEYREGEVFEIPGSTVRESGISADLSCSFNQAVPFPAFSVFGCNMRTKVSDGLIAFPDMSVVRGELELLDENRDLLLNPWLVAEVLAPWSESYDRGRKWEHYQSLPSLYAYLLVSSREPCIEAYTRSADGWQYHVFAGFDATLALPGVPAAIPLRTIYRRIAQ